MKEGNTTGKIVAGTITAGIGGVTVIGCSIIIFGVLGMLVLALAAGV